MNPLPLIPLSLLLSCAVAFLASCFKAKTFGRSLGVGMLVAVLGGFILPPVFLCLMMIAHGDGKDPVWVCETVAIIGGNLGLITGGLGIPCGAAAGAAARGVRVLFNIWFGRKAQAPLNNQALPQSDPDH